jgi:YidC/Oxa1 family membrane protein insertase
MQNKNTLITVGFLLLFMAGWWMLKGYLFPHPDQPHEEVKKPVEPERVARRPAAVAAAGPFVNFVPEPERIDRQISHPARKIVLGAQAKAVELPGAVAALPKKPSTRILLGSKDPDSKYHLAVTVDSHGAGVREVVLPIFQAVDERGQPEWEEPKKIRKPEVLVPEDPNGALSYLLFHFDPKNADKDPGGEQPLDTLGNVEWQVVSKPEPGEPSGDQRVVFQTQIGGVVVQKIYTLSEGTYHVGLEVKMFKADSSDSNDLWFRYQMAGAHGLPIEGRWYTTTFRNALVAIVDKANNSSVSRELQDARMLALKEGGDEVLRDPGHFIRYAAVAIQYFTSAIVVDDEQPRQDFLSRYRPTLEYATLKGTVKNVAFDQTSFVIVAGEHDERTIYLPPDASIEVAFAPGLPVGVVFRTDSRGRHQAVRVLAAKEVQALFENDPTVRVATEPVNLKDAIDEQHAVSHKYLLYNGPMKPMLLGHMRGSAHVNEELVDRYTNKLNLNTLIDYHSPGYLGAFCNSIGWTYIVIKATNLMHWFLGMLSSFLPYGVSILVLTVLVKGLMFPISRKAAMANIKMQELQPEIKKIKEKYKDDPAAMNSALMQFHRKAGINPLNTCWMMLLQMPIFMGLYYSLQESIHFRAASFWPTWINNLAAPDMLLPWGSNIPFVSAPESYGNFFYLGPYFNILPVLAVTLMIFQQKYTMPPPTDEQQEMQQKMMKYMMAFMGLMFYKVPSGLVMYFIASSIWGFCERKLLPKKKPTTAAAAGGPPQESNFLQNLLNKPAAAKQNETGITTAPSTAVTAGNGITKSERKGRNRNKAGKVKRRAGQGPAVEETLPAGNESVFQQFTNWWRRRRERVGDWWDKIQEEAQKKNR